MLDYKGINGTISFKYPILNDHLKNFDKEFFPLFSNYFNELLIIEDLWQKAIIQPPTGKNLDNYKKDVCKKMEKLLSLNIPDESLVPLFSTTRELLEKKLDLLQNNTGESLLLDKMKTLIF